MKKILLLFGLIFSYLALIAQTTFQIITTNYTCSGQTVTCGSMCSGNTNHYLGGTIKIRSATLVEDELTVTVEKCSQSNFLYGGVCALRERVCGCFSDNINTTTTFSGGSTTFSLSALLPPNFTTGDKTFYVMTDPVGGNGGDYYVTGGITVRATTATGSQYTISTSAVPAAGGRVTGGGTFNSGQTVTLTATPNAGYTFNGWYENNRFIPIPGNLSFPAAVNRTIEAHFSQNGVQQVATPVISPASTTFDAANLEISIECATDGAAIFYTLDGSEPTTNSERYLGPFLIRRTTTVKAIATYGNLDDSEIATKTYEQGHGAATEYNIVTFDPAPWQRSGETFNVRFKITTSDNSNYWIHYYAENSGADPVSKGPYISGRVYNETFQHNQLGKLIYEIGTESFVAKRASKTTKIIDKKIEYAIIDNQAASLSFPLKYVEEVNQYKTTFTRDNGLSRTVFGNLEGLFSNSNDFLGYPTPQLTFDNLVGYNNWNTLNSNLLSVPAGVFTYNTQYVSTTTYGDQRERFVESGIINITKISNISTHNASNKPVIVFVAGWLNEIQKDAENGISGASDESFSIMNHFAMDNNYDTWYIAQCNNNYVTENAYVLGLALQEIQRKTQCSEIHLICHSKGGLDLRAMLGNLGASQNGDIFDFDNSPLNGRIKTLTFLATPQDGSPWADDVAASMMAATGWGDSGGVVDLKVNSNAYIARTLSHAYLPKNIKYFNITGYLLYNAAVLSQTLFGNMTAAERREIELQLKRIISNSVELATQSSALGRAAGWIFLTGERLLTSDGVVPFTSSYRNSNNSFNWRGNGTPKLYQDFLETSHIDIHKVSYLNDLNRCPCSQQEALLPRIKKFINGTPFSICNLDANSSPRFIGSNLPNAHLFVKRANAAVSYIGKTTEEGLLRKYTPYNLRNNDSILVLANNYSTLTYRFMDNWGLCNKIPMFKNNSVGSNIMYPTVIPLSGTIISDNNIMSLKIRAENVNLFNIWNYRDSVNSYRNYSITDSIITVQLDTGINYFAVRFIGIGNDTVIITKLFYNFPPNDRRNQISYVSTLNFDNHLWGARIYVDDQIDQTVTNNTMTFRLSNGSHAIRVSKFGYIDTILYTYSTNNSNIILQRRVSTMPTDSNMLNISSNEVAQFWNGITVKNISNVQHNISLKRYEGNLNALNLIAQSETFEYRNWNAAVNKIKTAIILDVPNTPIKDSIYLLKRQNGRFQKIFVSDWGNNIQYEAEHQKLTIDTLDIQNGVQCSFVKRQKPLRNPTFSSLSVHQSEFLTIALTDLLKDPDLLTNDMTYDRVENPNFECTIIEDSLRLRHKTCQTGRLTFQLKATHDKFDITETFVIEVTPLTATTIPTAAKCFGTATGKVTLQISSQQIRNYNYLWNNGIHIQNNDSVFSGTYRVTVTDTNRCTVTSQAIVTQPADIVTTWTSDITSCHVVNGIRCDATARTTVLGGTGGYEYAWSGGQRVAAPNNLCAGTHTLIVKDAQGCKDTTQITIAQPDSLQTAFRNTFAESCDGRDGRTIIATTGSTPPYRYVWSNGETVYAPTGLTRGIHTVTVTDAHGCQTLRQVPIALNDQLRIDTLLATSLACHGDTNAVVTALASGATNLTFAWSNLRNTPILTGLSAGLYSVTVTTSAGCRREKTIQITEPPQLRLDSILVRVTPCVPESGFAQAFPSGGVAPYRYLWNTGRTHPTALHLTAGTYHVTVTDLHQCKVQQSVTVSVMPAFFARTAPQAAQCFGDSNGRISVFDVSGGNGSPYTFSLDGSRFGTQSYFDSLSAGAYNIRIHDSAGCEFSRSAIVLQPAEIVVDLDKRVLLPLGDSVQVFPRTLLRPEFQVHIAPNYHVSCADCLNPFVKPFFNTTYTVTVRDSVLGCFHRDSMTVWVENKRHLYIPNSFSPNQDGQNDYFAPFGGREVKRILKMSVFARNGAEIFRAVQLSPSAESEGWDGKFNGADMPIGIYMYVLEVEYFDDTQETFTGDINLFR